MDESKGIKGVLLEQLDSRASEAGNRVLATAANLKKVANDLRSDELSFAVAGLASQGAAGLERVGTYLTEADGERLVTDVEHFGRTRPWMVATTGLVLGMVASRMLKASAERRHPSDEGE